MMVNEEKLGELKSRMVANRTTGVEEVSKTENSDPVANLKNSVQIAKPRTKRTSVLSLDLEQRRVQSLQILRDSAEMARSDGVNVQISGFISKSGKQCTIILLENVNFVDDDLVWVE